MVPRIVGVVRSNACMHETELTTDHLDVHLVDCHGVQSHIKVRKQEVKRVLRLLRDHERVKRGTSSGRFALVCDAGEVNGVDVVHSVHCVPGALVRNFWESGANGDAT
jgi:CTP-dependent riboflavin kinase